MTRHSQNDGFSGQGGARLGSQVGIPSESPALGVSGFLCWVGWWEAGGGLRVGVGRSRAKSLGEATGRWAKEMGSQEVGRGSPEGNGGGMAVPGFGGADSGYSVRERREVRGGTTLDPPPGKGSRYPFCLACPLPVPRCAHLKLTCPTFGQYTPQSLPPAGLSHSLLHSFLLLHLWS